ncbi:unnamed protein product, partial [Prorocentrum cordatum]
DALATASATAPGAAKSPAAAAPYPPGPFSPLLSVRSISSSAPALTVGDTLAEMTIEITTMAQRFDAPLLRDAAAPRRGDADGARGKKQAAGSNGKTSKATNGKSADRAVGS